MTGHDGIAPEIASRLRAICLALPEAYEELAWVGMRWRVRGKTFAHLLTVDDGRPPAYARAVGDDGPVTIVTFRSSGPELAAVSNTGHPYFYGGWGRDVVGVILDHGTRAGAGWAEITELLTESYCLLAPRKLTALVDRPGDSSSRGT